MTLEVGLNNSIGNGSVNRGASVFWYLAGLCLIAVDQALKLAAFSRAFVSTSSGWLYLTQFKNAQFAFSVPLPAGLIYIIYALVLGVLIIYVYRNYVGFRLANYMAWTLIFAGSLSNIGERIALGYVRDFIYFYGGGIFNTADIYIVLGVLILILGTRKK